MFERPIIQKPEGIPLKVNWNNPLNQSLFFLSYPGGTHNWEITKGVLGYGSTANGNGNGSTLEGSAWQTLSSTLDGSIAWYPPNGSSFSSFWGNFGTGYTIITRMTIYNPQTTLSPVLSIADGSNTDAFEWGGKTSDAGISAGWYLRRRISGGVIETAFNDTSLFLSDGLSHTYAIRFRNNSFVTLRDGIGIGGISSSGSPIFTGQDSTHPISFLGNTLNPEGFKWVANGNFIGIWARDMSFQDIQIISKDPFALLQPEFDYCDHVIQALLNGIHISEFGLKEGTLASKGLTINNGIVEKTTTNEKILKLVLNNLTEQ